MSEFFELSPGNYQVVIDVHAECKEQLSAAQRRADRILDAYHMSYRHGPDPDPKRCPGCHAAALGATS